MNFAERPRVRGCSDTQACCSPLSNCVTGYPVQCSAECADIWLPFRRDCRRYLDGQPGLSDLGQACHDAGGKHGDSSATDVLNCPRGYHQYENNCYLFSLDTATYNIAEKSCEALGGELACINDQAENDFITSLLVGDDDYWIGYHDRNRESQFEWSNTQCTSTYENWLPTEPNNLASVRGSPDCVRMCPAGTSVGDVTQVIDGVTSTHSCTPGMWADFSCVHLNHYICEIRGCPDGWTAHGGSCYWFSEDQMAHDDASAACLAMGATLVHIDDAAENSWIAYSTPPQGTDDYWIGATNADTVGRNPDDTVGWEGAGLASDTDYANWLPGEPNNAAAGHNYDNGESNCVRLCPFGGSQGYTGGCTRGAWADFTCSTEFNYICEKVRSRTERIDTPLPPPA
jgi:hypothetical protein